MKEARLDRSESGPSKWKQFNIRQKMSIILFVVLVYVIISAILDFLFTGRIFFMHLF